MDKLSLMTVNVHRDMLRRHYQVKGLGPHLPGRGNLRPMWRPERLPPGYNGRDSYQDTPDPYVYPPRPMVKPAKPVTLREEALGTIMADDGDEAVRLAQGLVGTAVAVMVASRPPVYPEDLEKHLPMPEGQQRPLRNTFASLGAVPVPPAYPSSLEQPGNMQFVPPHEPAYVTKLTKALDNTYRPGPHSLGSTAALAAASTSNGGAAGGADAGMRPGRGSRARSGGPSASRSPEPRGNGGGGGGGSSSGPGGSSPQRQGSPWSTKSYEHSITDSLGLPQGLGVVGAVYSGSPGTTPPRSREGGSSAALTGLDPLGASLGVGAPTVASVPGKAVTMAPSTAVRTRTMPMPAKSELLPSWSMPQFRPGSSPLNDGMGLGGGSGPGSTR